MPRDGCLGTTARAYHTNATDCFFSCDPNTLAVTGQGGKHGHRGQRNRAVLGGDRRGRADALAPWRHGVRRGLAVHLQGAARRLPPDRTRSARSRRLDESVRLVHVPAMRVRRAGSASSPESSPGQGDWIEWRGHHCPAHGHGGAQLHRIDGARERTALLPRGGPLDPRGISRSRW